jgi:hypothetical protein
LKVRFNLHIHYFINYGSCNPTTGTSQKAIIRGSAVFDFLIPEDRLVLTRYPLRAGPGIRQSDPPRYHFLEFSKKGLDERNLIGND